LTQEKAAEMAKAQGEQKVASLKTNAEGLPAALVISREKTQKQLPQIVDAALRAYQQTACCEWC
jgi:hypothetical protein